MSFLSRSSGAPAASVEERKQQFMQEIQSRQAILNAQELVNKLNEKCFEKCVTKPGTSLGSSEQSCVSKCAERYIEAFNIISTTYIARLAKEREEGGSLA